MAMNWYNKKKGSYRITEACHNKGGEITAIEHAMQILVDNKKLKLVKLPKNYVLMKKILDV